MNPFKICLPSLSFHRDSIAFYAEQFDHESMFRIDKLVRQAVAANPSIQTSEMQAILQEQGFDAADVDTNEPLFLHGRAWDEHLVCGSHTFFVGFPETAPYELAGQMFLASTSADIFSIVTEADDGLRGVVLFTENHEPIYSSDTAFQDASHETRTNIGPVFLPLEQFDTQEAHGCAKKLLERSGFELLMSEAEV